jgi:pimeloyl-ACP methyl ester carboxylesterase
MRKFNTGGMAGCGLPPQETASWEALSVVTADGVRLSGVRSPADRSPATSGAPLTYVVLHGMTNATGRPGSAAVLSQLAQSGRVVAFDFRGHGRSGGRSTVGADEVLDVEAALAFARSEAPGGVVAIGFSLGGAVVIRHQGMVARQARVRPASSAESLPLQERADAVVTVSAPARWFLRETRAMLRVQWLLEHPLGLLIGRRLGIRLGSPWADIPTTPLEEVAFIPPTPLLLVHGTADHYFGVEQAHLLNHAAPGSQLRLISGMRHAESGISPATLTGISTWSQQATAAPRPPGSEEGTLG